MLQRTHASAAPDIRTHTIPTTGVALHARSPSSSPSRTHSYTNIIVYGRPAGESIFNQLLI